MFTKISNKFKSKNFDNRKKKISFIILHYTETKSLSEAIKLLTSKKRKVSCHFIVDKDGVIYDLVDINFRAWHAGESKWKKSSDINSRSIGIEIVNFGEKSKDKFTNEQINSLINLIKFLKKKYKIRNNKILGHSDIAPLRKIDPGKYFPWEYLSKKSIGIWVQNEKNNKALSHNQFCTFLKNLKRIGYPNITSYQLSKNNKKVIDSFHRHHVTNLVNKLPNMQSLIKSENLLKKY